jgi:hypothetical protein
LPREGTHGHDASHGLREMVDDWCFCDGSLALSALMKMPCSIAAETKIIAETFHISIQKDWTVNHHPLFA